MKRSPLRRRTPLRRTPLRPRRGRRTDYPEARRTVATRAGGRCEALTPDCTGWGAEAHHIRRRSQGGTDSPDNLLWCCSTCHRWIHNHPDQARTRGLLARLTGMLPSWFYQYHPAVEIDGDALFVCRRGQA